MGKSHFIPVSLMVKYEDMINDLFKPASEEVNALLEQERKRVKVEVMREWGITDMIIQKAGLAVKLKLIKESIDSYTADKIFPKYKQNKLDKEVDRRLTKKDIAQMVDGARDNIIEQIRLSAMPEEIRTVFEGAKRVVESITEKIAALPKPKQSTEKLDPAIREFAGTEEE